MPTARSPSSVASDAFRAQRYIVLASLAARQLTAPVVLDSSAPLLASGGESELVATVTFAPASCRFIAMTVEEGFVREVFSGPSLPLACSAANQALADLAPLASAITPRKAARYRRTRPAYEQDVHFADALNRLGELAGADLPSAH